MRKVSIGAPLVKYHNYPRKKRWNTLLFPIFLVGLILVIGNYFYPHITKLNAPKISISALEQTVHQLTNEQRIQNGLNPLSFDAKLAEIARKHSEDMSKRNFFSHVNPDQQTPTQRGDLLNYKCRKDYGNYYTEGIAENIFKSHLYHSITYYNGIPTFYDWISQNDLAKLTVDGWMSSPGHRQNILTNTYDREGIGVSINQATKEVYVTQNFC